MLMDHLSPVDRSSNMAKVRNKDTAPELTVRRLLHRAGYRFRLHRSELPGSPDIVLPRYRTAIFVHGCFWHEHPGCKRAKLPATRPEFWANKIERNRSRDEQAERALTALGFRTVTLWACQLRDTADVLRAVGKATGADKSNAKAITAGRGRGTSSPASRAAD